MKPGLPPGTIVPSVVDEGDRVPATISVFEYDRDTCKEWTDLPYKELSIDESSSVVSWVDVVGTHDVDVLQRLGAYFDIHPLILEDVANVSQRPKVDEYDEMVFVVLKMLRSRTEGGRGLIVEQIGILLGKGFVVTFQEVAGDVFEPVRQRIRDGRGRIRNAGADYLWYALIDAIVDHYLLIVDELDQQLEVLENELFTNPSAASLSLIDSMRKENIFMRRHVRPMRDLFNSLVRIDSPLIDKTTFTYLRDVHDHVVSVYETVDTFRDMISGQVDHYMSSMSNRMNEVMKFLTIIGSVFIPLTFIVGVYGMNFEHMPELHWRMGYPLIMALMALIGLGTFVYFKARTNL